MKMLKGATQNRMIREFLEAEKNGDQVCWSEDEALLVNHNLV